MKQARLAEVRVRIPYFRVNKWKDYPETQERALDTLIQVRDDLEDALEIIERQIDEQEAMRE